MAAILSRPQCVNIYHFYTSDVFYTDVYYFAFVVPKMYQWQVKNDFNKDVYIYIKLQLQTQTSAKEIKSVLLWRPDILVFLSDARPGA